MSDDELNKNSHFASPVTVLAYTRSIFSEINGCAGCACELSPQNPLSQQVRQTSMEIIPEN